MIKGILKMLKSSDFLIGDEDIDIAKGKYEQPRGFKDAKNNIKRNNPLMYNIQQPEFYRQVLIVMLK